MSDSKGRNVEKPQERVVAADDDNVPHLENMANVHGSNKHARPEPDVEQTDRTGADVES
ncbi:MAG: hypothetical protein ABI347_09680 [Nitrososphaera sp.]|jgi:hypothetical protein